MVSALFKPLTQAGSCDLIGPSPERGQPPFGDPITSQELVAGWNFGNIESMGQFYARLSLRQCIPSY
jgi:hypothetical protein